MENLLDKIQKSILLILEEESPRELYYTILQESKKITSIKSGFILKTDKGKITQVPLTINSEKVRLYKADKAYKLLSIKEVTVLTKPSSPEFIFFKNPTPQNILLIPLLSHGESLGAIIMFSNRKIIFSKKKISLLSLFAETTGIIIKKKELRSELQSALDMRDRFISLASHELRTPLTSLNGYIQLLHKKLSIRKSPELHLATALCEESDRLTRLIKELLDINRVKQGQLDFIFQEVNIVELVKTAIERFSLFREDREIVFTNKIKSDDGIIIGDFNKLLQMTSAIISNAVKFSKPNSIIQISLNQNKNYLTLQIKDQGKGIPKKETSKIFHGFYKIGKEEKQGMGVGLLLAEHIVRHHRGKIQIKSLNNKGTTITVKLPRSKRG